MLPIKYVPDELMKKYAEEVSKYYDVETLTNDSIICELKKLFQEGKRLEEILALMERVKGKHPDLMKVYGERDVIMDKIDRLQKFSSHRRNLIINEIENKRKKGPFRTQSI